MASTGDGTESEWIEKIKSEGAVPLLEPDSSSNGWASPPGEKFMVRGPDYFTNKTKIPAKEYLLKPLGFDWIKGSTKIGDILKNPNSRVRKAMDAEFPSGDKPFVWAFNLQVPCKENYSAVAYFVAKEPIPEQSLMAQFLNGDDGFRNSRLKLIANIVKGPWIVRKAVGEQAVCLIGRSLGCKFCVAENYFEADVDIGSSVVANAVVHLALGYITMLTVDIAFLIEGQTPSELPEQILGAVRFSGLNPASAKLYEPSREPPPRTLQSQSSLSKRLWMSLGQGLSQLLKPGAQGSNSNPGSPHSNGTSARETSNEDIKRW
ncbi:hypothetical protein M5689_022204 [Euphorbia peplus]|nr:hypothetical protein M5689_022204 [Euphorbia peplus]